MASTTGKMHHMYIIYYMIYLQFYADSGNIYMWLLPISKNVPLGNDRWRWLWFLENHLETITLCKISHILPDGYDIWNSFRVIYATQNLATLVEEFKKKCPKSAKVIRCDFYMDNLMIESDNEEGCLILHHEITCIMNSKNFILQK